MKVTKAEFWKKGSRDGPVAFHTAMAREPASSISGKPRSLGPWLLESASLTTVAHLMSKPRFSVDGGCKRGRERQGEVEEDGNGVAKRTIRRGLGCHSGEKLTVIALGEDASVRVDEGRDSALFVQLQVALRLVGQVNHLVLLAWRCREFGGLVSVCNVERMGFARSSSGWDSLDGRTS
jgi:hypothetical protein